MKVQCEYPAYCEYNYQYVPPSPPAVAVSLNHVSFGDLTITQSCRIKNIGYGNNNVQNTKVTPALIEENCHCNECCQHGYCPVSDICHIQNRRLGPTEGIWIPCTDVFVCDAQNLVDFVLQKQLER